VSTVLSATARAHANIALAKYWGKADVARNLPAVPSLSLTLAGMRTVTSVTFLPELTEDELVLGGVSQAGKPRERASKLLAQVRALFPPHMSGRAITAVNMFGFAGTALLQWWMGLIIGAFAPDAQGHYPAMAYAAAFLFTAVLTALALAWYATLARQPQAAVAPSSSPSYDRRL